MTELALMDINRRGNIADLEVEMLNMEESTVDFEDQTYHMFAPNMYCRTLKMYKGQYLVGKLHKTEHLFAVQSGTVRIYTEQDGLQIYTGPTQMVTKVGTKRAVYAETDCIMCTYHPTRETDVEKIEAACLAASYEELADMIDSDGLLRLENPLWSGQQ